MTRIRSPSSSLVCPVMSAPPVKKACDACHRRKVRCSGGAPCKNCSSATLQCTYLAIPQKKGPKGSRAKVISEIRDKQVVKTPPSTKSSQELERNPFDFNESPISPSYSRNPDLLTPQTIDSCVAFFFSHLYPTMPIFGQQGLNELISQHQENSLEVHCMIAALCAFIMVQPGMILHGTQSDLDGTEANSRHGHAILLLEEIQRLRKNIDYIETPTLLSVQTSFFVFCSYFGLEKPNQMYYHLRETGTLAHTLLMHDESSYHVGDPVENMYKRRLYWLILSTERAYAMERHRPLSLHATIDLPTVEEEPQEAQILNGFLHLVNLYRLIDEDFMSIWNKVKSECSTVWLSQLQQQLADALPPDLECTENQAADVVTTQHWLRTMVWQMSITNGYLSSSSHDAAMTFKYPIDIARDLVRDVKRLSQQSMEVHGIGLIEKLFDVACTLTDVIACVPMEGDIGESPSEYLNELLNLISQLRGGASRYQPLLVAKVSENLPSLSSYTNLPSSRRNQFPRLISHQSSGSSLPMLAPALSTSTSQNSAHSPFGVTSPYGDSHSRGLMFDQYSPNSHGSDSAITPLTPAVNMVGSPLNALGQMTNIVGPTPRSVPINCGINDSMKYEPFSN